MSGLNYRRDAPSSRRSAAVVLALWLLLTLAACESSDAPAPPRPGSEKAPAGQPGREDFPTGGAEGEYVALGDSFASGQGAPDVVRPATPCSPPVAQPPRPGTPPSQPCDTRSEQSYYEDGTDRPGVNMCHRAVNAYSVDIARALDLHLTFRACNGAKTEDYYSRNTEQKGEPPQQEALAGLGDQVKLVTLTLGGNDIGFGKVAANCAVTKLLRRPQARAWLGPFFALATSLPDCSGQVDKARSALPKLTAFEPQTPCQPPVAQPPRPGTPDPPPCRLQSTRSNLADLYRDLRAKAPRARILVLGYPRLFPIRPRGYCSTGFPPTIMTVKEMTRINRLVDELNQTTRLAIAEANAREARIEYVDVEDAFTGHDACVDSDQLRWVNRLHNPAVQSLRDESFHPTIAGHAAFRDRVMACWRDAQQCGSDEGPEASIDIRSAATTEPELVVEPDAMSERGLTLKDIRWHGWGERVATADASAQINICKPSCAEANYVVGAARLTAFDLHEEEDELIYGCLHIVTDRLEPQTAQAKELATPEDLRPKRTPEIAWISALLRPDPMGRQPRKCPDQPPS